jgi:GntR family transcriptional regulator, vanillate catabolism transcriptional regulator
MATQPTLPADPARGHFAGVGSDSGAERERSRAPEPERGDGIVSAAGGVEVGASQTVRAQLRLRELIVGGELRPGHRIAELAMVERLGMSRTPIRMALVRLQEEGLLEALPSGGFMVRQFSEADIRDAIELRGTLEGLAARLAAERGASPGKLAAMRDCLRAIDALLEAPALGGEAFSAYVAHNARFHALLAQMAGSELVARQIERAATLPFASPNAFVMAHDDAVKARDRLIVAHAQHHAVAEAIAAGQGARAEALMQEHARNAHHNLTEVLASQQALQRLPGARLIRRELAHG